MTKLVEENQYSYGSSLSRRGVIKRTGLMALGCLGLGGTSPERVGASIETSRWNIPSSQKARFEPVEVASQVRRKPATQLLATLQRQPGGAQAIEAARLSGLRLPVNPGMVPPFSVVLAPGQMQQGQSWGELQKVDLQSDSSIKMRASVAMAKFHIMFPKNGWYLLNIEGVLLAGWAVSATMKESSVVGKTIQTWAYPAANQAVNISLPALFEYQSAYKDVILYVDSGVFNFLEFSGEAL